MTTMKKQPVFKLKFGLVNLALFENTSPKGKWFSASLDRVYKHGDVFKRVSSFPEGEFDNVMHAIEAAKKYIVQGRV